MDMKFELTIQSQNERIVQRPVVTWVPNTALTSQGVKEETTGAIEAAAVAVETIEVDEEVATVVAVADGITEINGDLEAALVDDEPDHAVAIAIVDDLHHHIDDDRRHRIQADAQDLARQNITVNRANLTPY